MSNQLLVRVEPELKAAVARLAQSEGKSVSEVVRALMADYVRDRDPGAYIDDLWERVGAKLSARRVRPVDIERAIRESRTARQ